MVVSSDGKMIVDSGKRPCGICGKGVQTNNVKCTVCKRWIHKRCSGVRGNLSLVGDGFRCEGTSQEDYLDEDLVLHGETYGSVKSFCYLGEDLAATARIRNGWMKFQEIMPVLTSRAPLLEMKDRVYASCCMPSSTILIC